MTEQTEQQITADIGKKLKDIIDNVLAVGDWNSSLFLKTSATKLQELRARIKNLCGDVDLNGSVVKVDEIVDVVNHMVGYTRVFILVYQVDGANLQGWERTIKTLVEYGGTRPAYKEERYAREIVRSKVSGIEHNGYVIVNIKDDACYQVDQQVDALGNQLVALKEGAIQLGNVVEFVHANKKRYALRDNELVFLGEI